MNMTCLRSTAKQYNKSQADRAGRTRSCTQWKQLTEGRAFQVSTRLKVCHIDRSSAMALGFEVALQIVQSRMYGYHAQSCGAVCCAQH